VSTNGAVIVGQSFGKAARWTQGSDVQSLGFPPGGNKSFAFDVTPNVSKAVGLSASARGLEAYIWAQGNGMQSLNDLLTQNGISLGGWQLQLARGISDDGTVILGSGINTQGQPAGWIIIVPEATTVSHSLGAFDMFSVLNRRRPTSRDRD
jgi:uncharacterized membrane protein